MTDRLSFGVFTDAHYGWGEEQDCGEILDKMRQCLDTFNERDVAFVVNLGDLIDGTGDRGEDLQLLQKVASVFKRFNGPRHVVLGNHDLEGLGKEEFLEHCGTTVKKKYYAFDEAGVRFIVLDGNYHHDGTDFHAGNFTWDVAWMADDELEWLREELGRAGGQPVVVLTHENLDDRREEGTLDPHIVRNAEQVRAALAEARNVRVVLQGHDHGGLERLVEGIPYIGLKAMGRGRDCEANAFAIVTVEPEGTLRVEGFGRQDGFVLSH